jgi:hypothetical protein
MSDHAEESPKPQESGREEELVRELERTHAKEDELEQEIEQVQRREHEIEDELSRERKHHRDQHFFLIFIINGEDYHVETEPDSLLKVAVEKALIESGNKARRDPSEWEVRDSSGILLEMGRAIRDLGVHKGARLFLTLKVGAGGSQCE